jgi:hypothetical protein
VAGSAAGETSRGPSAARRVGRAPSWNEYWAFARLRLGLTKAEFFALTPCLFVELRDSYFAERHELRTMIGELRKDVINFSLCHPESPVTLDGLVPPLMKDTPPAAAPQFGHMSKCRRELVAGKMRAWFAPHVMQT